MFSRAQQMISMHGAVDSTFQVVLLSWEKGFRASPQPHLSLAHNSSRFPLLCGKVQCFFLCMLVSLSNNAFLSAMLSTCWEITAHERLLSFWLELFPKYHTVRAEHLIHFTSLFLKLSRFLSSVFVCRRITGFISASTLHKWIYWNGWFPFLWTTVFCASRWHAGANGCVYVCMLGLPSLTPSQTEHTDIPLEWQQPIMMSWAQQPLPV